MKVTLKSLAARRDVLFGAEKTLTRAALHLKAKGDLSRDELHSECVAYMVLVGALAQVRTELLEVLKDERRKRGLSV